MPFFKWSKTSAENASADPSINWREGQPPSSVNDSARAMMARTAEYRDDISGVLVTGGSSVAYTVSSNQHFDTLAHLHGAMIAFTPHETNDAAVTLNVDFLGAKPLRSAPDAALEAGVLIQGTPYIALYNDTDAAFYLHGMFGNPYNIPLGAGMDYWLPTAPNSSFAFPMGQAISRTAHAELFAGMGTTYGPGDGSTTFNLPDKTGRTSVMKEAAASRLTEGYFGGDSTVLGAVGGSEKQTLAMEHLPSATLDVDVPAGQGEHNHGTNGKNIFGGGMLAAGNERSYNDASVSAATLPAMTGTANFPGEDRAHPNVQPTIVCNYIMRVK